MPASAVAGLLPPAGASATGLLVATGCYHVVVAVPPVQRVFFNEGSGWVLTNCQASRAGRKNWLAVIREVGRVLLGAAGDGYNIENNWWCAVSGAVHAMNCSSVMLIVGAGCGLNANPATSTTGDWVVS